MVIYLHEVHLYSLCVFVCITVSLASLSHCVTCPSHWSVTFFYCTRLLHSRLSNQLPLLTVSLFPLADETSLQHDDYSPVHSHHIRERKYREETSYALLETDIASFDVREEIRQSISSVKQLRILEEQATPKNVTAQIGTTIYLHCIVEPIGDRMVITLAHT